MLKGILRSFSELVKDLVVRAWRPLAVYGIPARDGTIFAGMYSSHYDARKN
jgi:hypothetical protein